MAFRLFDSKLFKKNPSRPTQSHQIDYCNLLCNLVWVSAAVLETHCNIWKKNICVICVADYVYMTW